MQVKIADGRRLASSCVRHAGGELAGAGLLATSGAAQGAHAVSASRVCQVAGAHRGVARAAHGRADAPAARASLTLSLGLALARVARPVANQVVAGVQLCAPRRGFSWALHDAVHCRAARECSAPCHFTLRQSCTSSQQPRQLLCTRAGAAGHQQRNAHRQAGWASQRPQSSAPLHRRFGRRSTPARPACDASVCGPVANRRRKPSKPQQRGTSQRSWSNSLQMAIARSTLLGKGWYTPLARGSRSNPSSRAAILREQLH